MHTQLHATICRSLGPEHAGDEGAQAGQPDSLSAEERELLQVWLGAQEQAGLACSSNSWSCARKELDPQLSALRKAGCTLDCLHI